MAFRCVVPAPYRAGLVILVRSQQHPPLCSIGEKRRLKIPASLGYGESGSPPTIPGETSPGSWVSHVGLPVLTGLAHADLTKCMVRLTRGVAEASFWSIHCQCQGWLRHSGRERFAAQVELH